MQALVSMLASSQRKHVGRWMQSFRHGYLLDTPVPWLTFDAIDFISMHVGPHSRVFEYGSGGSTLFWAHLGARCTSVEHDGSWFHEVRRRLGDRAAVDYRLVAPESLPDGAADLDASDPRAYGTADASLRRHSFRAYASQIDQFPDEHFDVVLVDGRARPSCVMHGAPKVKPGGLLVIDNTERAYYLERTREYLADYTAHQFRGAVPSLAHWTCTTVLVRNVRMEPDRR